MQERKLNALKIRATRINSVNMIAAYGDCDICSVQLLKDAMTEIIAGGGKKLIVDARRLRYIDNSALAAVLWARHKMEESGGKLVLVGLNCARLKNSLGDLVKIANSIREALVYLNKGNLSYM